MKKKVCFLVCLFVCCLLYGCRIEAGLWELPWRKKPVDVQNDCALCGNRRDSMMGYYRRFDSIGVICMNTWGISDSQVRCYDENSGKEMFEQPRSSTIFNSYGEGECSFMIRGMYERGISEIDVHCGEKSVVDWERLSERLCSECLEKFKNMVGSEADLAEGRYKDVCLVDFKTGEVYSLEDWHTWYMIRDYYVMIDHGDDSDHITIFYAPVRKGSYGR